MPTSPCRSAPVNAALADFELLRDRGHAHALSGERLDLIGVFAGGRLPAPVLTGGLSHGDTFALTLQHHLALKLRDTRQDVEHQATGWCSGIDAHAEDT